MKGADPMTTNYTVTKHAEKVYSPIQQKTFKNALTQFFLQEFPNIGGEMIIDLLVDRVEELIESYYPGTERMSMGQILWFAVDENEKASYGKNMAKTRIRPVILTLVDSSDIEDLKHGIPVSRIKNRVIARLYNEAKQQGSVLAETDTSLIMHTTLTTISKKTKAYEKEHQTILPRRGTIHDLGRSVSHKKMICKKRKIEKKSISQIANEANHTPEAITRYTTDLERVEFCIQRKMSVDDISFVSQLSRNLILEYVNLIDDINKAKNFPLDENGELPF